MTTLTSPESMIMAREDLDATMEFLTEVRRSQLAVIGASDWTAESRELVDLELGRKQLLKIRGKYRGVNGRTVEFFEWQWLVDNSYYQVTFTQTLADPERPALDGTEIEALLAKFQPKD